MKKHYSHSTSSTDCMLQVLIDWINDELADFRIIVKDLEEDLFDGQILQKLIGMTLPAYFYKNCLLWVGS